MTFAKQLTEWQQKDNPSWSCRKILCHITISMRRKGILLLFLFLLQLAFLKEIVLGFFLLLFLFLVSFAVVAHVRSPFK